MQVSTGLSTWVFLKNFSTSVLHVNISKIWRLQWVIKTYVEIFQTDHEYDQRKRVKTSLSFCIHCVIVWKTNAGKSCILPSLGGIGIISVCLSANKNDDAIRHFTYSITVLHLS